jgi:peptidyl-prolyl cis-trans isomerase B (cyclophilin B)
LKKIILLLAISFLLINLGNQSFAESDKLVVLETNLGTIVIEFFFDDAPNHVDNFINLTESGFYDGTLFHRIIPGFMIQGGDPNTINGDPNTWGQGGPNETVNAEFNSIQHNRGIVSMARSTDPNSAGSQFFIVHQNSNFLDEEYTVFGRIVTESSFETLDKITAVQTGTSDRPINPEQVRISKVTVVERSNISNILKLSEPERTGSIVTNMPEFAVFENQELDVKFTVPVGWLLQQPQKSSEDAPDVVAVGPKVDGINPYISLTVKDVKGKTIDDLITAKNNILEQAVYQNQLEILSQEKVEENIYQTEAIGAFVVDDTSLKIKFIETMILINEKLYTFAYSNTVDNFDNELSKFNESLDSFKILSQEIPEEPVTENGGGCLIATATYGSEMALEVQQLRELRDNILLQTESGTNFMNTFNDIYYSFSPVIADYERENPVFKEIVKIAITPMISSLSILNYVDMDSESEVLGYGISLILLNLGMYLGIPAVVIVGIKKKF